MDKKEELKKHIYGQIQAGINPDEITKQLTAAGWDAQSIKEGFDGVKAQITPGPTAVSKEATPGNFEANGQKRGKLKTSWLLFKQSMKVLKNNKQLVRYPLMGGIISLVITCLFGILLFFMKDSLLIKTQKFGGGEDWNLSVPGYAVAIFYYIVTYFIVFIYNAGLAAHVLDIFRGKSDKYSHYMGIAWSKKIQILVYSIITTTVGLILNAIEQRSKILGPIVSKILGTVWAFANLFTIPIIVETNKSTPDAIKESAKLFISRWGENIAARVTFGLLAFLMYLLIGVPTFIVLGILLSFLGVGGIILFIALMVVSIVVFSVVINTASSVLSTGLYYYAQYNQIPAAYEASLLNSVFIAKKEKATK